MSIHASKIFVTFDVPAAVGTNEPSSSSMEIPSTSRSAPGRVDVTRLENGERVEEYTWYLSTFSPSSVTGFEVPLPKPTFHSGSFSHPLWVQKFNGTCKDRDINFILPYPEPDKEANLIWNLESMALGPCYLGQPVNTIALTKSFKELGPKSTPPWSRDAPAVKVGINIVVAGVMTHVALRPLHLIIKIKIVGKPQDYTKRAQLYSLIPAAFNSPELSDVKVVCEGETFLCHKFVLSIGSPVFKAMFLSDTKENKEGQVIVEGVGKEELRLTLSWMYGEGIDALIESPEQRVEVYKVAHRYLLDALKEFLVEDILHSITPEAAFALYVLGDTYDEERFMTAAKEVMIKERIRAFANDDVFDECVKRFPNLVKEIMRRK